ncbi:MAG: low molecular weight phosphatase family protein [Pseudomonadota bacterium]
MASSEQAHSTGENAIIRRVLFACTFNATRSPMAAGLLTYLQRGEIETSSVGVHHGERVDPDAVEVMDELGIDISRHRPLTLADLESWGDDPGDYDVIVALSPAAQRHALELTRFTPIAVEYWPAQDVTQPLAVNPGGEASDEDRLERYRSVRDDLLARLKQRFGRPSGVTV